MKELIEQERTIVKDRLELQKGREEGVEDMKEAPKKMTKENAEKGRRRPERTRAASGSEVCKGERQQSCDAL